MGEWAVRLFEVDAFAVVHRLAANAPAVDELSHHLADGPDVRGNAVDGLAVEGGENTLAGGHRAVLRHREGSGWARS